MEAGPYELSEPNQPAGPSSLKEHNEVGLLTQVKQAFYGLNFDLTGKQMAFNHIALINTPINHCTTLTFDLKTLSP